MTQPLTIWTRCRRCRKFFPWRSRCACQHVPLWRGLTWLGWAVAIPAGLLGWYGIYVVAAALLRAATGR